MLYCFSRYYVNQNNYFLRQGSGVAKEAAAQTLDKVKHAMQIDYFA